MQAQELRIGNYLEDNLFGVVKVYGINKDCVQIEDSKGDVYLLEIKDFSKPIPLTEEWLLKFGVQHESENNIFWITDDYYYDLEIQALIVSETYEEGTVYFKAKYVHQLQNLYFALTGEELTLK